VGVGLLKELPTEAVMPWVGGRNPVRLHTIGALKRSSDVIVDYVQREHNLLLGRRTASEVVRALVRGHLDDDDVFSEVRGRDLLTGLPKTIVLSRLELRDVLRGS